MQEKQLKEGNEHELDQWRRYGVGESASISTGLLMV
jgi:hypothetical protein